MCKKMEEVILVLLCVVFAGIAPAKITGFFDGFENFPAGNFTLPATPPIGYQWSMYSGALTNTIQNSIVSSGNQALQVTREPDTTGGNLQAFPLTTLGAANPEAGYDIITKQSWYRTANIGMAVHNMLGDGSVVSRWYTGGSTYMVWNSAAGSYYNTNVAVGMNQWETVELITAFVDAGNGQITGTVDMYLTVGDGPRTLIASDIPTATRAATTSNTRTWINPQGGPSTTYWDDVSIVKESSARCGDAEHPYPDGDFNKDCRVNLEDLAIMAVNWLVDTGPAE